MDHRVPDYVDGAADGEHTARRISFFDEDLTFMKIARCIPSLSIDDRNRPCCARLTAA
jgi:hypothetical protein